MKETGSNDSTVYLSCVQTKETRGDDYEGQNDFATGACPPQSVEWES